jgi:hypothetical protein
VALVEFRRLCFPQRGLPEGLLMEECFIPKTGRCD